MKYQLDIAREIMIAVEKCPTDRFNSNVKISGREFKDPDISYHVRILRDCGYLEVIDFSTQEEAYFIPLRITAAGVDFVSLFYDDIFWNHVKKTVMECISTPTHTLLMECAKKLLKNKLGI